VVIHVDTQSKKDDFVDNTFVLAYFDDNAIQINNRVDSIQGPGLPFSNLLNDRLGHFGNDGCRYVRIVHLFKRCHDFPRGHTLGIQA